MLIKRNNILLLYKEYVNNGEYPSIKESFNANPYPNQDKIIDYLNKGELLLPRMSVDKDIFTGEIINTISNGIMKNKEGTFSWSSDLSYYVEKYNMRLPKEFEEYVMERQ